LNLQDFGWEAGEVCVGFSYKKFFSLGLAIPNPESKLHDQYVAAENTIQKKLKEILRAGDANYMTQVELEDEKTGTITNYLYYSRREDDGIIYRVQLDLA